MDAITQRSEDCAKMPDRGHRLGWALSPVFLAMRPGSHHDLGNHCPGYIGQFIDHGKKDSGDGPQIDVR